MKLKHHKPKFSEKERLDKVRENNFVDKAILGDLNNPIKAIETEKPDLICLGYDQSGFAEHLQKIGLKIIRLKPYKPEIYKSTIQKQK